MAVPAGLDPDRMMRIVWLLAVQVLTAGGDRLPGRLVEAAATAAGLHLRTGCNCNPGRCLPNLGITPEEVRVVC